MIIHEFINNSLKKILNPKNHFHSMKGLKVENPKCTCY
jgi:hypothetical protein